MTTLTVLYGVPTDPDTFDEHYRSVHLPLAQKIPDVQDVVVRKVVATADGSPAQFRLIVNLTFADMDALGASMGSPEGKAAAADVANFATGGAQLLITEDFA